MRKNTVQLSAFLLTVSILLAACGKQETMGEQQETESNQSEVESSQDETESSQEDKEPEGIGQENQADDWTALREQMGFYVEGSTLYDANGNPFVLRGINHSHCWYENQAANAISGIAKTGSNCIRLVLADGEQWKATSAQAVEALIDQCRQENMIAILEVHDATGYKDKESLLKAAQYFVDLKDSLVGQEDYVMINIANE